MILVKCNCGCHFTVKDENFVKRSSFTCENCKTGVTYTENEQLNRLGKIFKDKNFQVYRIPDNFEIRFDLSTNDIDQIIT